MIAPIIKDHGFDVFAHYNKNIVVNSSSEEGGGSDSSSEMKKGSEKEIKQISETFTDTLDMIKGSIIRESGLSHG